MDLTAAVASEDRRTQLGAVRDNLAARLAVADDRSAAPLAKQLTDVLAVLAELPSVEESSPVDDLTAKRAHRRSGAKGPVGAAKDGIVGS